MIPENAAHGNLLPELGCISNRGWVRRQAIAIAATTAKPNLRELRPEIRMHPLPGYAAAPRVED